VASAVVGTLRILLEANASKLESEFDKATVTIGQFDKFVDKAGNHLQQMVTRFSGQKIVTEAVKMAGAIEAIGGTAKLTDKELMRVASTVNEATAKLRAMGAEVPPSIAKLQGGIDALGLGTQKTTGLLSGFGSVLGKLGPLLPITSVAGLATALVSLGSNAFESAGKIVDLSGKTGLSTKAIQQMQAVADQTGTSLDAFTTAAFKLGINVAEGTDKARSAVAGLGIEYDKLRAMKPEDQFTTVVRALEQVESVQERNRIGVALFGKQFAEIAAAVAEGYTGMADAARISGDAQLKALDKAGDAWQRFKNDVSKGVTSILGNIVLMVETVGTGMENLTDAEKNLIAFTKKNGGDMAAVLEQIRRNHARKEDIALPFAEGSKAVSDYTAQLKAAQAEVSGLSAAQKNQLNAAIKLGGEAAKDYAESINLSDAALRLYQSGTKAAVKSINEASEAQKKWNASIKFFDADVKAISVGGGAQWLATMGQLAPSLSDAADKADILAATLPPLASSTLIATAGFEEFKQALDDTGTSALPTFLDKLNDSLLKLPDLLTQAFTGGGGFSGAFKALFSEIGGSITGSLFGAGGPLNAIGNSLTKGIGNIFGKGIGDAFGTFLPGIGAILGPLIGKLGGLFKNLFGGVSEEVKQARTDLEAFQDTLRDTLTEGERSGLADWQQDLVAIRNAYLALGKTAAEAEADAAALWDTDNPERSRAAIERITAALKAQEAQLAKNKDEARDLFEGLIDAAAETGERLPAAFLPGIESLRQMGLLTDEQAAKLSALADEGSFDLKQLQEDAQALGIDFNALGPKFQSAKLGAGFEDLFLKMSRLINANGDLGTVLSGSADEISALVVEAKKFGTNVPQQFKPWIEELLRAGKLVDENGEALKDLSGINFGDPIVTAMERMIDKLEEFLNKILGIPGAIDKIPKHVDIEFTGTFTPPDVTTQPVGSPTEFGAGGSLRLASSILSAGALSGLDARLGASALSVAPSGLDARGSDSGLAAAVLAAVAAVDRTVQNLQLTLPIQMRDAVRGAV
jgi:hypothetical protein